MKTNFKKSEVNFGCYSIDQVNNANLKDNFTITDVLNVDVKLKDKAWFIRNNCELTTIELRQFAIGCALCVLPIYEIKYPTLKPPREAIEAAQAYLNGTINIEQLRIKRDAGDGAVADAYAAAYADAAYAAADAAYAAAAAADAAAAGDAAAAAYAVADAAYAAAYAGDAAAAADAAAAGVGNYIITLLNFFIDFTKQ